MENGENSVVDGKKLTDEQLGKLQRKLDEIKKRINLGAIRFEDARDLLQKVIIEAKPEAHKFHLGVADGTHRILPVSIFDSMILTWREKGEVIYFSVTSDGTTGEQWIIRLETAGYRVSEHARSLLLSPKFKPTTGITTEIAVLKGKLFTDSERITRKIRLEAQKLNLTKIEIGPEVACLIQIMFSDEDIKDMGLWWIVVMHKPIKDGGGHPRLLRVIRGSVGPWLRTYYGQSDIGWDRNGGFAFAISQTKLEA
jgi:hypothetical protein